MKSKKRWVKVGEIGVDSGLVWIGDPCYVLHKGDNGYKDLGTSWGDFCDKVYDGKDPVMKSFGTLGACVASGLGDGVYAVKALVQEVRGCGPRVCAIQVTFVRKSERV